MIAYSGQRCPCKSFFFLCVGNGQEHADTRNTKSKCVSGGMKMSHVARLTLSVLALVVVLLFATGVYADDFTITITGTAVPSGAYAGDSISGTLDVVASPDSLGDGGFLVSSITDGSVTLTNGSTSSTYAENGLVPLGAPGSYVDPRYSGYVYDFPTCTSCFHYFGYDNLLYPGTSDPIDGLLLYLSGSPSSGVPDLSEPV